METKTILEKQRKECKSFTLLTNISEVGYNGCKIYTKAILIDNEINDNGFGKFKLIKGIGFGGLPTFQFLIEGDTEIKVKDHEGGRFIIGGGEDNKFHNLDRGCIIEAGNLRIIAVVDNFRDKIHIEQLSEYPLPEESDEKIIPHQGGINYPRVVWTPLSHKVD